MPKHTTPLALAAGALILAAAPAMAKPAGTGPTHKSHTMPSSSTSTGAGNRADTGPDTRSGMPDTGPDATRPGNPDAPGKPDPNSATPANADGSIPADVPGPSSADASAKILADPRASDAINSSLTKGGVTLPSGGLQEACTGFDSLGSCISALHVAQNLNLPGGFDALKPLVTGESKVSLGAAIQRLQPGADATGAVTKAQAQAQADLATASPH